jgi:hypothetical protein
VQKVCRRLNCKQQAIQLLLLLQLRLLVGVSRHLLRLHPIRMKRRHCLNALKQLLSACNNNGNSKRSSKSRQLRARLLRLLQLAQLLAPILLLLLLVQQTALSA